MRRVALTLHSSRLSIAPALGANRLPSTFVDSDIRLAHGEREYINVITLARGEIMLRMVKLRRLAVKSTPAALVKSPRNARWCMRYHAKHAIL